MEYGIWSLQAAAGLWADPRLTARHFPLSPDVLGRFNRTPSTLGLDEVPDEAMELTVKSSTSDLAQVEASPPRELRDNEDNEAENDDDIDNQSPARSRANQHCEAGEVSDSGSTNSSHPSAVSNISNRTIDPASFFSFDKDETVTPVLNGWVLGAYTAMLGRLSAATAALEATELPSDSDSDSDVSSYTEGDGSRGNSPIAGSYRGYPCGSCEVVTSTRPALKKHILECHPALSPRSEESEATSVRQCPATSCEFTSSSRYEMETHVATHAAAGVTSSAKKRLALQRVRYRYEREEYRCSLCSYACTIEKAFQRHLRAHAKGTAPKSRVSCAVCGADRSSEVDLSRHMRRHRDDRYFCCDICVFRTVQLKKLIQHRRMHTGEKPHLCPHCAYRSARRDNLRSHVRRVHKKENLYCDTFSPRGMLINASSSSSSKSSDESTAALVHIPASSPSSNAAHEVLD